MPGWRPPGAQAASGVIAFKHLTCCTMAAEKLEAAFTSTSSGSSASAEPSNTKKQIAGNIIAITM